MREYKVSDIVKKIKCNMCGKEIMVEKGIVRQGVFSCDYEWGYFSSKDGEIHSFDLCESCYDKMIEQFKILPEIRESTEMI